MNVGPIVERNAPVCRNHSHLIVAPSPESTKEGPPVHTFLLQQSDLLIETKEIAGQAWKLRTTGRLYVPSWMLDGSSPLRGLQMEALPMSLSLVPDAGPIITQVVLESYLISCVTSGIL